LEKLSDCQFPKKNVFLRLVRDVCVFTCTYSAVKIVMISDLFSLSIKNKESTFPVGSLLLGFSSDQGWTVLFGWRAISPS
jgi:hypothetical protein